jgi:hypothetical protein
MHAIQSFLIVVLCVFVWLTIILGLVLAEEITIYDRDWQVKERVRGGTIYDRGWRVKGYIEDGKVYDRNWNLEKRIEDGKNYDVSRQGAKFAKGKESHKKIFPGR